MLMGSDVGAVWKPGEKRGSKMVFIGRDMPKEVPLDGLAQCVAGSPAAREPPVVTHPNAAQEGRVRPFRWDDDQALFYARPIASSDYVQRVAPMLGACRTSFLDAGAGSGVLGSRLAQTGSEWPAVEPQPAMQALPRSLSMIADVRFNRREPTESGAGRWQMTLTSPQGSVEGVLRSPSLPLRIVCEMPTPC